MENVEAHGIVEQGRSREIVLLIIANFARDLCVNSPGLIGSDTRLSPEKIMGPLMIGLYPVLVKISSSGSFGNSDISALRNTLSPFIGRCTNFNPEIKIFFIELARIVQNEQFGFELIKIIMENLKNNLQTEVLSAVDSVMNPSASLTSGK